MTTYNQAINNLQANDRNTIQTLQNNNNDLANYAQRAAKSELENLSFLSKTAGELVIGMHQQKVKKQTADLMVEMYRSRKVDEERLAEIKQLNTLKDKHSLEVSARIAELKKQGSHTPEFLNALKSADPKALETVSKAVLLQKAKNYSSYVEHHMLNSTKSIDLFEDGKGGKYSIKISDIGKTDDHDEMSARMQAADVIQRDWFLENGIAGFSNEWLHDIGVYDELRKQDAALYKGWSGAINVKESSRNRRIALQNFYTEQTPDALMNYVLTTAGGVNLDNEDISLSDAWGEDYLEKAVLEGMLSGTLPPNFIEYMRTQDVPGMPKGTKFEKWDTRWGKNGTLERKYKSEYNKMADSISKLKKSRVKVDKADLEESIQDDLNNGASRQQIEATYGPRLKLLRKNAKLADITDATDGIDSLLSSIDSPHTGQLLGEALKKVDEGTMLDETSLAAAVKKDPTVAKRLKFQKKLENSNIWKNDLVKPLEVLFRKGLSVEVNGLGVAQYTDPQREGLRDLKNQLFKQIVSAQSPDGVSYSENGELPPSAQLLQIGKDINKFFIEEGGEQSGPKFKNGTGRYIYDSSVGQDGLVKGFKNLKSDYQPVTITGGKIGHTQIVGNLRDRQLESKVSWPKFITQNPEKLGLRPTHGVPGHYDYNKWIPENPNKIPPDVARIVEASNGVLSPFDVMAARQTEGKLDDNIIPNAYKEIGYSKLTLKSRRCMNLALCGIPVDDRSAREVVATYTTEHGIKKTIDLGFGVTSGKFDTKDDNEAGTLEVTTRTLAGRLGLPPNIFANDIADPKAYQEYVGKLGLIVDDLNNPFYKSLIETIPSLQTTET
tara:strand:+ start:5590 stop:8094 length:2505 start_codon:yes stop_codon:yes gene_type:complete